MRVFYFASDTKSEGKKTGLSPVGDTAANTNTNTISQIHSRIQTHAQYALFGMPHTSKPAKHLCELKLDPSLNPFQKIDVAGPFGWISCMQCSEKYVHA